MKGQGFFGRLFGKGKQEEAPPLSVESVMARVFSAGLAGSVAEGVQPAALSMDEAEAEMRSCAAGVTSSVSTGSDESQLTILYPKAYLDLAASRLPAEPSAVQDPVRRAVLSTEGRLHRLVALEPPAGTEEEGLERPISEHPALRAWRTYAAAGADGLLWRVGQCSAWRVAVGGSSLLVFIPEELAERMADAFGASAAYQEAVRAALLGEPGTEERAAPGVPLSVAVSSSSVFPAGALFCPVRVACGSHVLQSRVESVLLGQQAAASLSAPGVVWTGTSCTLGGKAVVAHYGFDVGTADKAAAMAQTIRQLLACQYREAVRSLGGLDAAARPQEPKIVPGSRPDATKAGGYAVLKALTTVGAMRLPCQVWLPLPSVAAVCARALDGWEMRQLQAEKPAALSALLALNQKLLERGVGRLHQEYLEARTGQAPSAQTGFFPFAAFVELAGDRDVRLALQNCVLHNLDLRPLRSLFCYVEKVTGKDGKVATRQMTPYAVDEARVLRFLPHSHAEQWTGRATNLLDRAGYLSANAETMKGIREAVRRGHLLLTRRGRLILEKMYQPTVQATATAKIDELQKGRVPFADMEKLDRPRIQELLSRSPARTVCLSLLRASEADVALVRKNTSKSKFTQLSEDLTVVKRQLEEGSLDVEEAVAAKQALAEEARRVLEGDEESGRAKKPAPAAAAGGPVKRTFRSKAVPLATS